MNFYLPYYLFFAKRSLTKTGRQNQIKNQHGINGMCTENRYLRGGADKSLARTTSRCRRTESIVSLERGVCSCAELQAFLVIEAERKHVRRRTRFQQHRDASCHQEFFL